MALRLRRAVHLRDRLKNFCPRTPEMRPRLLQLVPLESFASSINCMKEFSKKKKHRGVGGGQALANVDTKYK